MSSFQDFFRMGKKGSSYLVVLIVFTASVHSKVVNSDKNDVSTSNETVSVLNIDDSNKTQYLNQNFRSGSYNYGYDIKPEGPNGQFHHENKAEDGVVYGCYGYLDPNDKAQITYYVSDAWGYRPVSTGDSLKLFYPADHPEGTSEMKGVMREWAQLSFPKQCTNLEQDIGTPFAAASTRIENLPPPALLTAPPSMTNYRPETQIIHQTSREVYYPGTLGKPGAPGMRLNGGYGGEGGTGGLASGSAAANGGPGGRGGDGGTSSGSSKANGGNGGNGGDAGVASGSSTANGGGGGNGGDGGEASGSSNASGGNGGTGAKGGSASGSSNANGGTAGSGGRGGVASGSSTALGGNGGHGGEGGIASGSSTARGGSGGTGGRGGNATGSSSANGGNAGSGGRGGNASGSSSASAGDGGSAGNGGNASGSSAANGGSGGAGGSGAGGKQTASSEKGGYSYTPPSTHIGSTTSIKNIQPPKTRLPLPASGGLLAQEQYTDQSSNQKFRPNSGFSTTSSGNKVVSTHTTKEGYTYPKPSSSQQGTFLSQKVKGVQTPGFGNDLSSNAGNTVYGNNQKHHTINIGNTDYGSTQKHHTSSSGNTQYGSTQKHQTSNSGDIESGNNQKFHGSNTGSSEYGNNQNQHGSNTGSSEYGNNQNHHGSNTGSSEYGNNQNSPGGGRPTQTSQYEHNRFTTHSQGQPGGSGSTQEIGQNPMKIPKQTVESGNNPNYSPGTASQTHGLNPSVFQSTTSGNRFHNKNSFYPPKPASTPHPNQVPVPAGGYVPPYESFESGEQGQYPSGMDSGEEVPTVSTGCDQGQGFSSCATQSPPPEIDYARLPGAITSNVPVIFYPDCRSNAYTRPAIVPFCPSLQQGPPAQSSCFHQQPLSMTFPTGGNPYNNIPVSRVPYSSSFGSVFSSLKSRPSVRVVKRVKHSSRNRFI